MEMRDQRLLLFREGTVEKVAEAFEEVVHSGLNRAFFLYFLSFFNCPGPWARRGAGF